MQIERIQYLIPYKLPPQSRSVQIDAPILGADAVEFDTDARKRREGNQQQTSKEESGSPNENDKEKKEKSASPHVDIIV